MTKLFLTIMFALVLLFSGTGEGTATAKQAVTDEDVTRFLMAPAASPEAQAVKDRIIWERIAGQIVTELK